MSGALQRLFLALYRHAARSPIMRSSFGQRVFETAYLTYKSVFEARSTARLRRYVKPGTTVIDVGANIGFFSTLFADWVGADGRVLAVEPEGANIRALKRRLNRHRHGRRVTVIEGVAGERSGTYNLVVNPDHPGDHRLGEVGAPVDGWTLDDLVETHNAGPVSFIKIDVQGAEAMVLRGAKRLLQRDKPTLFIEIDPDALAAMGTSATSLVEMMAELGWRGRVWTRDGPGSAIDAETLTSATKSRGYMDALFAPRD